MTNEEIQKQFQFFAESDWNSQGIIYLDALERLAAERDRADRAEARIADAWDEGYAAPIDAGHWENDRPKEGMRMWVPDLAPNPYRPFATA